MKKSHEKQEKMPALSNHPNEATQRRTMAEAAVRQDFASTEKYQHRGRRQPAKK